METMTALFTRAAYDLLPEGFPAQLIEGCLVKEPSPTYGHQCLSSRIHAALLALVGPDRALTAPADVVIDEVNVYQPDLLVLKGPADVHKSDVGIPLLAVEILSPASRQRDREVKRHRLLAAGVAEVWLVDSLRPEVEVWDLDGVRQARGHTALHSRVLDGFSLTPDVLFVPPGSA